MKKNYLLLLALLTLSINAHAQVVAQYVTPTTGTLDGVSFQFTNLTSPNGPSFTADLSGTGFSGGPLSNAENMFQVNQDTNWTVTFSTPINKLRLYCKFWRTGSISFDQEFTVLSAESDFTNPSGNTINTTAYTDGLIEFTNPITTLNLTHLTAGVDGYEGITFGLENPLSVTDHQIINNNKLQIYPNPANHFIQVRGINKTEQYTIYNIFGRKIKEGVITEKEQINLNNLTNGLYFISLRNQNKITFKFIKE